MSCTSISFRVSSFRKVATPFDRKPGYRDYMTVAEVTDIPDLDKWRRINVRDAKLTTSLARDIRDSFLSNLDTFVFLSRGLVLAVDSVSFAKDPEKPNADEGIVTINLKDPKLHGLLDGGHNYEIIMQYRDQLSAKGDRQYVKLEILEGFDSNDLVKLVEARNSSTQVRDESLMNLDGKFERISARLGKERYFKKIAFSEYEIDEHGDPKPIDIREIISLLMVMDRENFSDHVHPINSYRSKAACLEHFRTHEQAFRKIYPIAPDVLRLWDTIHQKLPALYNQARPLVSEVTGGRFGKLTGVTHFRNGKGISLDFTGATSQYVVPAGFKYPILGAFRAILEEESNGYAWGTDPFELLEGPLGTKLANTIGEFALEAKNPSKTGKSPVVWQSCYQSVELEYLRMRSGKTRSRKTLF